MLKNLSVAVAAQDIWWLYWRLQIATEQSTSVISSALHSFCVLFL